MDPFQPMPDDAPPIPVLNVHPVERKGMCCRDGGVMPGRGRMIHQPPENPLHTNVFYSNFYLGDQGNSIFPHPYSMQWARGGGNARSWGLAISHIEREQLAMGPVNNVNNASQFYINPIGIHSIILSAQELGPSTVLTTDSHSCFSANANLVVAPGAPPIVTFPLLQGMAFVTAVYDNATPLVQSSVFIRGMSNLQDVNGLRRYQLTLEDGRNWLLYIDFKGSEPCDFKLMNNTTIAGRSGFRGTIQIAKLPPGCDVAIFDQSAGAYPVDCTVSAECNGGNATYTFTWRKAGLVRPLLMYALPHHISSLDPRWHTSITPTQLWTTTKGLATAVVGDQWVMQERLPSHMTFAPWHRDTGSVTRLSDSVRQRINDLAQTEIDQDYMSQCCLDSMYFSGKGLGKFAMMIITLRDILQNPDLAYRGLEKLKQAFAVFTENRQPNPLTYDATWKGVISTAGIRYDAGADFGNSWYNDHHFHYGYFVYAAAVIAAMDPPWLAQGNNRAYVNMLVRDFANPTNDTHFPFSRAFDWYNGHSWAKGLFDSADGKDQESTSEDAFASYALKMWGMASGDASTEARGSLMLAIQARTFPLYFLMDSENTVQPQGFIGNKVTGILFENKADHATYFGMNPEYIQGIHMIPLAPCSSLMRSPQFVGEEFQVYFDRGRVDQVAGGWRGILWCNLTLCDPGAAKAAFDFFNQPNFDYGWLDGGASRVWYLAFTAALAGL